MTKFFVDTNVLLYLVDEDKIKTGRALSLLDLGLIISAQVLNEFVNTSRRKFKLSWEEIDTSLELFKRKFVIVPITLATHELALKIAKDIKIGIYDANIVAAAELAGCDTLYTEDLNDGQRIGRVTIRNPFMVA
jgi:predicted nucleic acid-binding protein